MRKFLFFSYLFITLVMISGCSPSPIPIQHTATTFPITNVTCHELTFYLDPALGTNVACETMPEVSSSDIPVNYPFIYPTHIELTIQDYPMSGTQFPPQIWIYPLDRYGELLPAIISPRLTDLKGLIEGKPLTSKEMPFLPPIPQIQSFHLHEIPLSFKGGAGVRYITVYSDGPHPITNKNIVYTFQGLTGDGKYWVAVTLPISNPILPADYDVFPEGYTRESLIQNHAAYVLEIEGQLIAQDPSSYFPALIDLDDLVRSITVKD